MANKDIFCAVPWHNSHLYWDGAYGACCSERHKPQGIEKNLVNTNIIEWYNSDAMKDFRLRILGNEKLSECQGCYIEESRGHESRRIKENFKVGIFTQQAFTKSYHQSPWIEKFNYSKNTGSTDKLPIDLHIDFGNECNLACKMCSPSASSRIAQQYVKWQIPANKKTNWTNSNTLYQNFLKNIQSLPRIHRIHIMGGEPLYNKKFYQFVDWLIQNKRTDISLSFVTNGTIFDNNFVKKLQAFNTVDIEISVESVHANNHYIRQGSSTQQVLVNILNFVKYRSQSFNIVLRSVPQLFNVNNYHELILFAYENKLSIQSNPLISPAHLAINILPQHIRNNFIKNYNKVKEILAKNLPQFQTLATGRDTSRLEQQLIKECDTIIKMLNESCPDNVDQIRTELVDWISKWDAVYKLDATEFFPEYKQFLADCGYK
jgi:MoaA/NifB/PqqE/SkfB family radical SAM enzyme